MINTKPAGSGSTLTTRGSTRLGASGLLVLGLGALVLLAGLAPPVPATNDALALAGVAATIDVPSFPNWLGGIALVGVALIAIGARRFQTFFLRATTA